MYASGVVRGRSLLGAVAAGGLALAPRPAWPAEALEAAPNEPVNRPPTPRRPFLQYGVAFTIEGVASAGPICSAPNAPCILGSGGGVVVRVGWRPTEFFYIGGAYEFSKQDPKNLYRLGILQQARAEMRRYFPIGWTTMPFVQLGAGLAGYGDEWSVDTWGLTAALGGGVEVELSGAVHLGVALVYRPLFLATWVDSSTIRHDGGIAHLVGLEFALEAQDPVGEAAASRGSP